MKKLFLLVCLVFSFTLRAQVLPDSSFVPTCMSDEFNKGVYVQYMVVLFESKDSIDLNKINLLTDVVLPYNVEYYDPIDYKLKNLCVLGLEDDGRISNIFGFSEEYANYLYDTHKSIYPKMEIVKFYYNQ